MRKNMDIGLDDGYITPILVPGICDDAEPEPLAVFTIDLLSKSGVLIKHKIRPNVWEEGKTKTIFAVWKEPKLSNN